MRKEDSTLRGLEAAEEERRWEQLTIADSFIFSKVMSNEKNCTELLRRIFPELDIGFVRIGEPEKTLETGWDSHGVRLDVYAEEGNRVFDMEMQMASSPMLPKRGMEARVYDGFDL